ncbi:hypothetical protein CCACVL1_12282 [Corchorus capsularis]|uniref:Uncharacterized protein n=1 Tax=Corchorus capsularis TaxID=210143 RepID=A0A1R3IGS0_COCAP|nr:hypothetical protein CCACVL1_12282 [Corchorus capsularis]
MTTTPTWGLEDHCRCADKFSSNYFACLLFRVFAGLLFRVFGDLCCKRVKAGELAKNGVKCQNKFKALQLGIATWPNRAPIEPDS